MLRRSLLAFLGLAGAAPAAALVTSTAQPATPVSATAPKSLFERDCAHWLADPKTDFPVLSGNFTSTVSRVSVDEVTQFVSFLTYHPRTYPVESLHRLVRAGAPDRLVAVGSVDKVEDRHKIAENGVSRVELYAGTAYIPRYSDLRVG